MGVIAVHHPSGVDTGEHRSYVAMDEHIRRHGGDPAEWIRLFTRIPPSAGGYVGPENDPKWRAAHGIVYTDPPVDDHPVGVHRI